LARMDLRRAGRRHSEVDLPRRYSAAKASRDPKLSLMLWYRLNGTNVCRGSQLPRLDIGRDDHLAPFLGFASDELTEIGRRTWKHRSA
jgi:hypothetical protein